MVRLFMVTVLNYQNPVHEYGVHWNFFFTLASTRILTSLVYAAVPVHVDWVVAVVLACVYEGCLLYTPLALFLDNNDRSGFLAANKEGLTSIVGYVVLHLAAAATARMLGYKPRNAACDWIVTGLQAAGVSAVAFAATYVMHTAVDPVSRRLANVSYCLWMVVLRREKKGYWSARHGSHDWHDHAGLVVAKSHGRDPAPPSSMNREHNSTGVLARHQGSHDTTIQFVDTDNEDTPPSGLGRRVRTPE
ncbi:hypothetical protein HPB50_023604 [Hyalomma asiaticum]|uniref:Uncharacterized protein n=1 Tax=Hyalomma asiaticum TaxID=266040 RepID=A0ACB7T4C2_HYAAI|nr:hypothetical protein HPB50_023604 [Hyalomma asiaticum]